MTIRSMNRIIEVLSKEIDCLKEDRDAARNIADGYHAYIREMEEEDIDGTVSDYRAHMEKLKTDEKYIALKEEENEAYSRYSEINNTLTATEIAKSEFISYQW